MKSLKKILAAFLAVLMVAFSVPFSALAADESKPNIHVTAYNCYTLNTSASVFWCQRILYAFWASAGVLAHTYIPQNNAHISMRKPIHT